MMSHLRISLLRWQICRELAQQRLQIVPELEKPSLCGRATWSLPVPGADLRGRRPALGGTGSGSRGQRSPRPLLGGGQAVAQTAHAVRARQSSHPLIRLDTCDIASLGGKNAKSGNFGSQF